MSNVNLHLDLDNTHFGASLLLEDLESTNPFHFAQQTITNLNSFGKDLPPLPDDIADSTPIVGSTLPVTQSVHQQIAKPFFIGAAHDAVLSTPDMFAASQSSATSSHLQPSSVSEDQPQNISSSSSPTSEANQPGPQKVSKRKQPAAPKSVKGKRQKSTSSKTAVDSPPDTEDPLLRALKAFQDRKEVKKGCIAKALGESGMNYSNNDVRKLEKCIKALADYFHHEDMHGTVSHKAFRKICNERKASQSKVADLLEVARPEKTLYLAYRDKKNAPIVVKEKSTTKRVRAKPSSTKPDEYEPIIKAFQESKGTIELRDIAKEHLGANPKKAGAVRRYINVIARCLHYEFTHNTIISNRSDPVLESFCVGGGKIGPDRILQLLPVARPEILFYVNYYKST